MGRKSLNTIKQEAIAARRDDVMTQLLRGQKTGQILEEMSIKHDVSKATIERDLTFCYAEMEYSYDPNLPEKVNKHVMKYSQVFHSAMASKDHRSAIEALKGIERILHLHAEVPLIAIQQNHLNLESLSLPELQALLD